MRNWIYVSVMQHGTVLASNGYDTVPLLRKFCVLHCHCGK